MQKVHVNCSTEKHLKVGLKHIRQTCIEINNYLHWVIAKVFKEIKEITQSGVKNQVEKAKNKSIKIICCSTIKGEKGVHIVNSTKRYANKILSENVKVQTDHSGN